MHKAYEKKDVLRYLMITIGFCAAMKFAGGVGFLFLVPFALSALLRGKSVSLVWCLLLANTTLAMNGYFTPKDLLFGITHRALLGVIGIYGALLFLASKQSKYIKPLMGILPFIFYMIIPSVNGWEPTISLLKLFLFFTVYMALAFVGNKSISDNRFDICKLRAMLIALAIFFIIGSVLVAPFSSISSMNALEILESGREFTSLYKGMCNHSQTLGMVMAFWIVFLFADMIFHVQKFDKLYGLLIFTAMGLLYKSSGRTAMGMMLACSLFAYLFFIKYRGKVTVGWRQKIGPVIALIVVGATIAAMTVPQIRDGIVRYAMKYDTDARYGDFNVEKAVSTRQGIVEEQLYNFKRRPVIGWGFQVSEQVAEMSKNVKGLILTAPVEKGVWVTAILEEGGICGEVIYIVYFIAALCLLYARKAYMGLTIFLAIHVSNLGEMTMFSMSGVGGMWYTFLFMALIFDAKREQMNQFGGLNYA